MAKMTEAEAWTFSDFVLNNTITFGPEGSGWLSKREMLAWGLEDKTVNYIIKKAMEDHKPPVQIINELVSKEMSAASM